MNDFEKAAERFEKSMDRWIGYIQKLPSIAVSAAMVHQAGIIMATLTPRRDAKRRAINQCFLNATQCLLDAGFELEGF